MGKIILSLLLFWLAGNLSAIRAQNPPVELTGKIKSLKLVRENDRSIEFGLKIELEFHNQSDRPVWLSKRKPWEISVYLASSVENLARREYLYRAGGGAANDVAARWDRYRRKLDRPAPPKKHFREVLPNRSWRFETAIGISLTKIVDHGNGFSFDAWNNINWAEINALPELWLRLNVPLWFSNIEAIDDREEKRFGKKLRRQWARDGFLWLDDLQSEPLRLDLKSALGKD